MIVSTFPVTGYLTTNTYFYIDEKSRHGWIIDPAAEAETLLDTILQNQWIIEKILITHGHFDHIGAVKQIADQLNIPYFIHSLGKDFLLNPQLNLSAMTPQDIILPQAQYVNDGDVIKLSTSPDTTLKIIHTPGHTTDSVTYYDAANHLAFVGDTVFKDSIGATHFPSGDLATLANSIKNKILLFPDNTVLYSGHGKKTTVKDEKPNLLML